VPIRWYNEWIAKGIGEDTYLTTVEVRFALLIGVVSNRKTPYVRYSPPPRKSSS